MSQWPCIHRVLAISACLLPVTCCKHFPVSRVESFNAISRSCIIFSSPFVVLCFIFCSVPCKHAPFPPPVPTKSGPPLGLLLSETLKPRRIHVGEKGGGLRCFREKQISRQNTTHLLCYALFCFDLRYRGGLLSAVSHIHAQFTDKIRSDDTLSSIT
ncbi:hypothetical protein LZ31DRAFT_366818 [Colletotrichum somersetense]|nr:hypothetical protein LZ31DRAFT_366818 [Colletotrichum somersetense]